jgi:hypothetical protein
MSMDRSFRVELDFLRSGASEALEKAVQRKVLNTLPSATKPVSLAKACAALIDLRNSTLGAMCSIASQGQIDCVHEIVSLMQRGISPDPAIAKGGNFYELVMTQLPFFQRLTVNGQAVLGSAAVKHSFQVMKERMAAAPEEVKLFELEAFQSYKWLLSPTHAAELCGWVKATLQVMASSSSSSPSSSSLQMVSSATSSKKEKHSSVLSYFG